MYDLKNYTDKSQPNTWKTHHALNIITSVNFVLEHNISSTSKTHSDASLTSICWDICLFHDDVIKGKLFPRHWPFVWGIHRSPVNSPYKGQWRGALIFSLICVWINSWINNRKAHDLRRYQVHCDVIVIFNTGNTVNVLVTYTYSWSLIQTICYDISVPSHCLS